MHASGVYETIQSKYRGKQLRREIWNRPGNSSKAEVNSWERHSPHSSLPLRITRNASPRPLSPRKLRNGYPNPRRRARSPSPLKPLLRRSPSPPFSRKQNRSPRPRRRSIVRRIDEIQDSLRRLGETSALRKTSNADIPLSPPPLRCPRRSLGQSPRRSKSPFRYFSFPIQRSPSPYDISSSTHSTRSPSMPTPAVVHDVPRAPRRPSPLITTPHPSRSPEPDHHPHPQQLPPLHWSRPPPGIFDSLSPIHYNWDVSEGVDIHLHYGSLQMKKTGTDDLDGLTMNALKRRLAEALVDLEIERARRIEVDRILRDVERECRQPCVLPSLILAVKDFPLIGELL